MSDTELAMGVSVMTVCIIIIGIWVIRSKYNNSDSYTRVPPKPRIEGYQPTRPTNPQGEPPRKRWVHVPPNDNKPRIRQVYNSLSTTKPVLYYQCKDSSSKLIGWGKTPDEAYRSYMTYVVNA